MKEITFLKFPKSLLFLLFFTQFCVGQLSNFTLTVVPTHATCTANGALSFTTAGTTAGATMLYSIYLLPNTTTAIATLSGNTYGGLVPGTYRVVATQSLGAQSASKQQDVVILNQIVPLTYQLAGINSTGCSNNGQITVNVTSGTAVSYEIFSGPVIKPLQPSNVFTGLAAGVYQVRVFNNCGEGVVQTYTLLNSPAGMQISSSTGSPPTNCVSVPANHSFSPLPGSVIAYPLTVVLTLFPPSGPPIVYTQTIPTGNPNGQSFTQDIALYANQGYTYNLMVTDACGNVYNANNNQASSNTTPTILPLSGFVNCVDSGSILISVIQTATLVAAPAAYSNTLPYNYTPLIQPGGVLTVAPLPPGTYTFNVTDVCGNPHVLTATVDPSAIPQPTFSVREGCDATTGSVSINSPSGPIVSIVMTQAPATYTLSSLPHNVGFNINPNNAQNFQMNMLPAGNYRFHIVDSCGSQFDVNVTIAGLQAPINNYTLTQNCGSFNLLFHYASNNTFNNTFWLQKLNPATGQWGHPGTGVVFNPGDILNATNARSIGNNVNNINLAYLGTFRIIMGFQIFGLGDFMSTYCTRVIQQFNFDDTPQIISVYSFSCNNNSSDVIVNATGLGPLIYRITTKNGLPFVVNNGTSNIFTGLQPATYNFQVEDTCGNILNSLHDISTPFSFQITANNLCDGQTASLGVASFPFLTYQWWKAGAPGTILSTTSTLQFPSFNSVTSQGTYFVHIVNPTNNSCIDETLSYVISANPAAPNAGSNGAASYCGSQSSINLFPLLTGTYDLNGVWSALSSGGTLNNNIWDATGVAPGVYQFKYTVTGFCNATDDATVTITIKAIPQTPTASANPIICATQPLQLSATTVPNATYHWTGPNNFTSSLQNPVISSVSAANAGTYSVEVVQNGCTSGSSSVTVQVAPMPNAGTNGAMSYCGSQNTIDLFTLLNGNYDPNGVWSALSTGGTLTNNIWNAAGVAAGVYQFKYTVTGTCNLSVAATVTITFHPITPTPTATVAPVVCDAQSLQLFATAIPNATYAWTGPNSFSSSQQNPVINAVSAANNGVYSVQAFQNGCPSGFSTVTVQVAPTPQFALAFDCDNNTAKLLATPVPGSFDPATASYQWSNANGFASTDNPVIITGEVPGTYSLTVTNTDGCSNTQTIEVANTLCSIPNGISPNGDGLNDAFDLSGFGGITMVKIFNRYGMVVFEQENYVKEWVGQDKRGNTLPSATYFYLVTLENGEPKTGWVYLMREND